MVSDGPTNAANDAGSGDLSTGRFSAVVVGCAAIGLRNRSIKKISLLFALLGSL